MRWSVARDFTKDTHAVMDFQINWVTWLVTDTIATSTWIVPDGLTKVSDSNTTTTTTIWLSGGTIGVLYELTNRITTAAGRTDDRTIRITVKEK